jgi:hypothetical protein
MEAWSQKSELPIGLAKFHETWSQINRYPSKRAGKTWWKLKNLTKLGHKKIRYSSNRLGKNVTKDWSQKTEILPNERAKFHGTSNMWPKLGHKKYDLPKGCTKFHWTSKMYQSNKEKFPKGWATFQGTGKMWPKLGYKKNSKMWPKLSHKHSMEFQKCDQCLVTKHLAFQKCMENSMELQKCDQSLVTKNLAFQKDREISIELQKYD